MVFSEWSVRRCYKQEKLAVRCELVGELQNIIWLCEISVGLTKMVRKRRSFYILGASASRWASTKLAVSFLLSVRMRWLKYHSEKFYNFFIIAGLYKLLGTVQFPLKPGKHNGHLTWWTSYIYALVLSVTGSIFIGEIYIYIWNRCCIEKSSAQIDNNFPQDLRSSIYLK
jgi:hypothetical protein